jgi:glycine cleavage system H protein
MNFPSELKYTKDHEWARKEDDIITIGITEYAQGELGDVVFVELPATGDEVSQDETFGTIEAVKAVADLFSPLSGEVAEINEKLGDQPDIVNSDPYGDGWMVKIKISDENQWNCLMSAEEYKDLIG